MASLTLLRITQQLPTTLRRRLETDLSLLQKQLTSVTGPEELFDRCEDIEHYREKFLEEKKITDAWRQNAAKWKRRYRIMKEQYSDMRERAQALEELNSLEKSTPIPRCTCRICGLHKRLGCAQAQKDCSTCRLRPCHQDAQQKQARRDKYKEIGKKGGIAKHKNGGPETRLDGALE